MLCTPCKRTGSSSARVSGTSRPSLREMKYRVPEAWICRKWAKRFVPDIWQWPVKAAGLAGDGQPSRCWSRGQPYRSSTSKTTEDQIDPKQSIRSLKLRDGVQTDVREVLMQCDSGHVAPEGHLLFSSAFFALPSRPLAHCHRHP